MTPPWIWVHGKPYPAQARKKKVGKRGLTCGTRMVSLIEYRNDSAVGLQLMSLVVREMEIVESERNVARLFT
jgi:hypothetical protein